MWRRNWNFGSVAGGLIAAGGAIAILTILGNGRFPPRGVKVVFFALLGGAALGNLIWRLAGPGDEGLSERDKERFKL